MLVDFPMEMLDCLADMFELVQLAFGLVTAAKVVIRLF